MKTKTKKKKGGKRPATGMNSASLPALENSGLVGGISTAALGPLLVLESSERQTTPPKACGSGETS